MCSVRRKMSFSKKHWRQRKRVVALNIQRENTSGGVETDSAPGRSPKNLTRICAARKTGARGIKRREAEPRTT
jgi:hypothetical protein